MMLERTLKLFIDAKLDWYRSDSRRLDKFLIDTCGIEAAEAAKVRTFFDAGGDPKVVIGYARSAGPFPCFAITLAADNPRQRAIGNEMGPPGVLIDADGLEETDEFLDEDRQNAEGHVWIVSARYDVWVYALDNPDICLYYYYLLRHAILANIDELLAGNVEDLEMSGADMAPDPRYLPENIFVRRLSLALTVEEQAFKAQIRATTVTGLTHEDTGGGIVPYEE